MRRRIAFLILLAFSFAAAGYAKSSKVGSSAEKKLKSAAPVAVALVNGKWDPRKELSLINSFVTEAQDLLKARKYKALEGVARLLRKNRAEFPSGESAVNKFYSGLADIGLGEDEDKAEDRSSEWDELEGRLIKWNLATKSGESELALARFLLRRGAMARGDGWAHEVTEKGWEGLRKNLMSSEYHLNKAFELIPDEPYSYLVLASNNLGKGREDSWWEDIAAKATALNPRFIGVDYVMASAYLPRWGGAPGKMERCLDRAAKRPGGLGEAAYALIASSYLTMFQRDLFKDTELDRDRMNRAFEGMVKKNGSQLAKSRWSYVLSLTPGREDEAIALFEELKGECDLMIWGSKARPLRYLARLKSDKAGH